MGWRLIKGWECPDGKIEPHDLKREDDVSWRVVSETGAFGLYDESEMKGMPDWFQFTPDLPEGWVRPEDTDAEWGWVMVNSGYIHLAQKKQNTWWTISARGNDTDSVCLGFGIEAIYPLQKPKI